MNYILKGRTVGYMTTEFPTGPSNSGIGPSSAENKKKREEQIAAIRPLIARYARQPSDKLRNEILQRATACARHQQVLTILRALDTR